MANATRITRHPFIVRWVKCALDTISVFSLFNLAEKNLFLKSFYWVEVYGLIFFGLSIVSYVLSFVVSNIIFQLAVFALLAARIWEYVPYVLRVLIFTEPNKGTTDLYNARRTLILLMFNYVEMIFWFATLYSILASHNWLHIKVHPHSHWITVLRESIMLMVANWSGNFTDLSTRAWIAVSFQEFFGLFMTIMMVARFISFLPSPTSSIDIKKKKKK